MTNAGLSELIAMRVREERKDRGWSVSELAKRADVSSRTLVNVEGGANATLDTLVAIADALGVPLTQLLAPPPAARMTIARAADARTVEVGARMLRHLATVSICERLELTHVTLARGTRFAAEGHGRDVFERIYLVKGRLRFGPIDDPVILHRGDFATLHADVDHLYEAIGSDAEIFLAMTDERPRQHHIASAPDDDPEAESSERAS